MLRRMTGISFFSKSSNASVTKSSVVLNKEYPEVFAFLHPQKQREYENKLIPIKTSLVWKCPNGPDHEWEASAKNGIDRYNISKYKSII